MSKQTLVFESPVHGLPAERHRQGIPGNLQPFQQHQGSPKMAQIPGLTQNASAGCVRS